jgi:hypothetical protein
LQALIIRRNTIIAFLNIGNSLIVVMLEKRNNSKKLVFKNWGKDLSLPDLMWWGLR